MTMVNKELMRPGYREHAAALVGTTCRTTPYHSSGHWVVLVDCLSGLLSPYPPRALVNVTVAVVSMMSTRSPHTISYSWYSQEQRYILHRYFCDMKIRRSLSRANSRKLFSHCLQKSNPWKPSRQLGPLEIELRVSQGLNM